jgi:Tfp pilus assembly protein PilP
MHRSCLHHRTVRARAIAAAGRRIHRCGMRATVFIALLLMPLLLVTGCGSSEDDDALAAVCSARDDISKQVEELRSLTLTTATTSQVTESMQAISDGLKTIGDNREKLSDDRRKEVDAANEAFADQVTSLAGTIGRTVSVEGAKAELESSLDQLAASYKDTFGRIDCS